MRALLQPCWPVRSVAWSVQATACCVRCGSWASYSAAARGQQERMARLSRSGTPEADAACRERTGTCCRAATAPTLFWSPISRVCSALLTSKLKAPMRSTSDPNARCHRALRNLHAPAAPPVPACRPRSQRPAAPVARLQRPAPAPRPPAAARSAPAAPQACRSGRRPRRPRRPPGAASQRCCERIPLLLGRSPRWPCAPRPLPPPPPRT